MAFAPVSYARILALWQVLYPFQLLFWELHLQMNRCPNAFVLWKKKPRNNYQVKCQPRPRAIHAKPLMALLLSSPFTVFVYMNGFISAKDHIDGSIHYIRVHTLYTVVTTLGGGEGGEGGGFAAFS